MVSKKIEVYSVPTCPFCKKVKAYLREKGLSFTDHDVSKNPDEARAMTRKYGVMSVPIVDVEGEVVIGFNRKRLDELLEG